MGRALAYDLAKHDKRCHILLVDRDRSNLQRACKDLPKKRISCKAWDLDNATDRDLDVFCHGATVVCSASRYDLNVTLTRAAIRAKAHFIDLGGNTATVEEQFALHDEAVAAGVSVLPDCGIAPGAVSVLAKHCLDRVPNAEKVFIRVGGLPQNPKPPLNYAIAFSAHGLVANYGEPCEVIREGKLEVVPPLTDREYQAFAGLGRLEAVCTSDGLATLAKTYAGRIRQMDYKTLRWDGHWEKIRVLHDLGLFDDTREHDVGGVHVTAREFMTAFFNGTLEHDVPDLLVLRVGALAPAVGKDMRRGLVVDLIDRKDEKLGHSAMQRTTGYSAAICAAMLARGNIKKRGVLKHEEDVPTERFIEEWAKRGLTLTEHDHNP